jgi:hypothetical protein
MDEPASSEPIPVSEPAYRPSYTKHSLSSPTLSIERTPERLPLRRASFNRSNGAPMTFCRAAVVTLVVALCAASCNESEPHDEASTVEVRDGGSRVTSGSDSEAASVEADGGAVACGKVQGGERCCPMRWMPQGHCSTELANTSCWRACVSISSGETVRTQLACGPDGVLRAGMGLHSCIP